jgi:hypothetical protein
VWVTDPLIASFSGQRPHSTANRATKAIQEVLLRISRLVEAIPEISEIDLNPIVVLPEGHGCKIADARIRVEPPRRPAI